MAVRILLINGPKRVGKTTIGDLIAATTPGCIRVNMADRLKLITNAFYDIKQYGQIAPADFMEDQKDVPMDIFGGRTYRQALIYISEEVIKPLHGDCVFGHWAAERITKSYEATIAVGSAKSDILFVMSDSGFASEVVPLIEKFGAQSIALVRLSGLDATFDGDSRSYVYSKDVFNFSGRPGMFPIGPNKIQPENALGGFGFEAEFVNHAGDPAQTAQKIIDEICDNYSWSRFFSGQKHEAHGPGL